MSHSSVVLMISASSSPGTSRKEITEHWEWLEHNLLQTLSIFENENDITTFVKGKVQVRSTKRRLVFGQENSCKLETCWLRIEVKSCWEVLEAQASKASLENPPQPLDAEFQLLPLKRRYTSNKFFTSTAPSFHVACCSCCCGSSLYRCSDIAGFFFQSFNTARFWLRFSL